MGAGEEYHMFSVKASLSLVPLSNDQMGRYFASYQEIEEQHYERLANIFSICSSTESFFHLRPFILNMNGSIL